MLLGKKNVYILQVRIVLSVLINAKWQISKCVTDAANE